MRIPWICVAGLFVSELCAGQSIPSVKTKALDDSEVVLPKAGGRQGLILILGFSRKGGDSCAPWSKKIAAEFGEDPDVTYYSIPVLQDVPSFVRPMIVHGMKKGMPAKEMAHMAPVYTDEETWKKLVGYSAPDDAYLLVTDAEGKVVWQGHGVYSEAEYAELKKTVQGMKEKRRN